MSEWEPNADVVVKAAVAVRRRQFERTRRASFDKTVLPTEAEVDNASAAIKAAVAADPLLRTAADLRAALIEAQAALNGAPNTQGLHSQIEAALRASDRGASHE